MAEHEVLPALADRAQAARAERVARKEGKIAGLREAAKLLVQWGASARENGDEFEGLAYEEAAESLRQVAGRLEEEG